MALLFKPNGNLDIATAATDLPSQSSSPGSVYSEALTRCKNLRIDRKGVLTTRDGSSRINTTPFSTSSEELITNGTFNSSLTGWTTSGSVSWSPGPAYTANFSTDAGHMQFLSASAYAEQAISTQDNRAYVLSFRAVGNSISVSVSIGTTSGGSEIDSGTFPEGNQQITFTSTATTIYIRFSGIGSLDNISVLELTPDPVNLIIEQAGDRYEFSLDSIFKNEASIASDLTNAQWSGIKYNQFNDATQQIFALNGTDRKRIDDDTVYEWGITPPSAPTVAAGASTGLTGSYKAKVTYCRKVGSVVVSESNPSDASSPVTLTNQSLSVTWTASADPQVTHVRVYRTLAGGDTYFHDQDIAIGTLTVDSTTANTSLGDAVEEDHDRPPLGQFVSGPAFDGTCFIVKDNLLHYCKPKQPEYWPALYFIEVSTVQEPGTCPVHFHNGQPYFFTKNRIYLIQGTGHGNLLPIPMDAKTGAQGVFGVAVVRGVGMFHTGPDGIYLFSGTDAKLTEATLNPIFRGEDANGIPGVSSMETAWLHVFGNYLYFGYASEGFDYPNNVLVFNLDTKRTSYYAYNDGTVVQIRCVTNDETNSRILAGDTLGFVRHIENKDETEDSGEAIDWEVQSMDYTLQTRRHFPRYAKYDVDASEAESCTGEIIVDDETVQSHTISGSRNVRHRHIETCNGKRCAIRISGSGTASIYAAELE